MDVFLSHPHHPDHGFWASGQIPIIGPSAQPNQRLTRDQWQMLEHHFSQDRKPTTVVKRGIAQSMNVPLEKINNWFQNRRAKARQEQKKAEAAARDGGPLPESSNVDSSAEDSQTLQLRPSSQPIGTSHQPSSLTPPQQPVPDSLSSYSQSTISSPEELNCDPLNGISRSMSRDTSYEASYISSLASAAPPCQPLLVMPNENMSVTNVYPSPEETAFPSPEQQFQIASQSASTSSSQSPEGFQPTIAHNFSEAIGVQSIMSSESGLQHNAFIPSDASVPDIAFPDPQPDSVLTSAMTFADYPPFFGGLSLPSTPTFPDGSMGEMYNIVSTQGPPQMISAPSDISSSKVYHLELPGTNTLLNTSNVSLPSVSEHSSPDQVMPAPDSAKLFKLRQSSQSNLASRRRKNTPGAIVVKPVGSMGRSGSYTAGMPIAHPLSPRSPLLTAPEQSLRRIKSSNNTAGRIQKPMTPAQRSPLVFAFTHNSHLLDDHTPPPSASAVETPSICNVTYPNVQSMFPQGMEFNVPWSAPPTQQEFMFPPDLHAFPAPGVLPSTPSPTSHPQYLPV